MTVMTLIMDGDGAMAHLRGRETIQLERMSIALLVGGMSSGQPSISIFFELPDGKVVFAQTSFKLFMAAADVLRARFRN